jgi:hypothetical protein
MQVRNQVRVEHQHAMILRQRSDAVRIGNIKSAVYRIKGEPACATQDLIARIRVALGEDDLSKNSPRRLAADKILCLERRRQKREKQYGCELSQTGDLKKT